MSYLCGVNPNHHLWDLTEDIIKTPCQDAWWLLAGALIFIVIMNELLDIRGEQTMSSLQIAEITGKRHDAVLRDIRNLLEQGVDVHNFVETFYTDKSNRQSPCYQLTKTGCLILASGYSAVLREKIINRWIELEMKHAMKIPQTYAEALRLAADRVEENERLLLENNRLSDKIAEIAPKADYCDKILRSPDPIIVTQIAKDYGMSPQELNKRLKSLGVQYKVNGQWVLYAKYQGEGYTVSQTGLKQNSNGTWMQTAWTQQGRLFLYYTLKDAGVLPIIERGKGYELPPISKNKDKENSYWQ